MLEELFTIDPYPAPLLGLLHRCPSIKLKIFRARWSHLRWLSAVLDAAPTIQILGVYVVFTDSVNDLVGALTVRRGMESMCIGPNVDAIALAVEDANINPRLFLMMVESRWRLHVEGGPCCRLRSVELLILKAGSITLSPEIVHKLKVFQSEGLEVRVLQGEEATERLLGWQICP
ncbi:hypothetical protein C8R44DRAFT_993017 [Mycena epipterygia]|nr:hypothetical protein C8R44DRAFT_993017 [Mycena epipterygia]